MVFRVFRVSKEKYRKYIYSIFPEAEISLLSFYLFGQPTAWRCSWARDRTHTTEVTQVIELIAPDF